MDVVNNPHDKFFKQVLGDRKTAKDFLTNYLPQDLLSTIELDSLEIQKDTYIDEELREQLSDILYTVKIKGKKGYIYFLFEHKSYPYQAIALQLLKYMVKIWDQKAIKENKSTLPPVIPLLLYHGKEKWQHNPNLSSLIEGIEELPDNIKRYIPDYEYVFYDFSPYSAEDIRGGVELQIFISLLHSILKKKMSF